MVIMNSLGGSPDVDSLNCPAVRLARAASSVAGYCPSYPATTVHETQPDDAPAAQQAGLLCVTG